MIPRLKMFRYLVEEILRTCQARADLRFQCSTHEDECEERPYNGDRRCWLPLWGRFLSVFPYMQQFKYLFYDIWKFVFTLIKNFYQRNAARSACLKSILSALMPHLIDEGGFIPTLTLPQKRK